MKKIALMVLVLLGGLLGGLVLSITIIDSSFQLFGASFGSLILLLPVAGAGIALMCSCVNGMVDRTGDGEILRQEKRACVRF
ncbi:hypothetical protein [Saccharococcus caldoxylosilyticus]|uniref:hypothetical protein n=1 Tax=Saccharococcus caldoxylosilyticus TaxID=81408 RepID=UPI001FCAF7A9|nr:hypothetical protein [Parageobacillus caldoxylosilyticus]